MGKYTLGFLDYARKSSHMSIDTGPINDVTLGTVEGQVGALRDAIDAVTLGTLKSETLAAFDNKLSDIPPVSKEAQRVKKWLISYVDTTPFLDPPVNSIANPGYQKAFSNHIPTADAAQLNVPNSNEVNLTIAPWTTLVTDFQAAARSPYGGQPQVTRILFVDK